MVERKNPAHILIPGGTAKDVEEFIERDFQTRNGMCPNGHGLLTPTDFGQQCATCKFFTNVRAELKAQ